MRLGSWYPTLTTKSAARMGHPASEVFIHGEPSTVYRGRGEKQGIGKGDLVRLGSWYPTLAAKSAARMGHPASEVFIHGEPGTVYRGRGEKQGIGKRDLVRLGSWYPTLATKSAARMGHPASEVVIHGEPGMGDSVQNCTVYRGRGEKQGIGKRDLVRLGSWYPTLATKSAARMGHPASEVVIHGEPGMGDSVQNCTVYRGRGEKQGIGKGDLVRLGSWYPTLATKSAARMGHPASEVVIHDYMTALAPSG